jgi:hypothetical protein
MLQRHGGSPRRCGRNVARRFLQALWLASLLSCPAARAQELSDDANVSYLYAAIMGSGTYKIDGRRISMLRVPFSLTQRELSAEQAGVKWHAPVAVGYDNIAENDWLGTVFDESPVTLALLPGLEYQVPLNGTWTAKPFGHIGFAHDFVLERTALLAVVGARVLGIWHYPGGDELRWGFAFRFAGEYQDEQDYHDQFALFETGIDYRRFLGVNALDQPLNAGAYYLLQYFRPDWDIAQMPWRDYDIQMTHEVGVSVGLKTPRKVFGIPISRVRLGYKLGDGLRGWSLGTEFPL